MNWAKVVCAPLLAGMLVLPAKALADDAAKLVDAALARIPQTWIYNGGYRSIAYPGGDVPNYMGVCTDVIIRSYRKLDLDIQVLVHEDMKTNFAAYPDHWGLKRPDPNIDHRRVPNLRRFFERQGASLPITQNVADYEPGDIVSWALGERGGTPHIGIVSNKKARSGRYMIVHNIGLGTELEDVLFDYTITGHYRYLPED